MRMARHWLAGCLAWLFLALPAWADFSGKVVGVQDGDTLKVMHEGRAVRIRMTGIDAPERHQAFGQVSRAYLADRVFGKVVTVEDRGVDRYGRTLGRVLYLGKDINLEQIEAGLAWHYSRYAHQQPGPEAYVYAGVERLAREARVGLWRDRQPVPPWEYRRRAAESR